jgi:NADPH:quinone reductase-like Zn-dependent oxidoreductase
VLVSAVSVNPVDRMMRSGAVKDLFPVEFPDILVIDLAGIVREVGEGVAGFEPGDHVMAMTVHTYAELCTVKATDLIKIPDGLEMTTAATLPLVNITGDQLIRVCTENLSSGVVVVKSAKVACD